MEAAAIGKIVVTALKKTVREPEKILSGLAKFLITVSVGFVLLGVIMTSLVGCFQGADLDMENFNPMEAPIYRETLEAYDHYMAVLQETVEQRKEELKEEYMETVTETVPVFIDGYWKEVEVLKQTIVMEFIPGQMLENGLFFPGYWIPKVVEHYETERQYVEGYYIEESVSREVCTARIEIRVNPVNLSYILAYMTVTNEDILAQKEGVSIDRREISGVLDFITPVKEQKQAVPEEEQEKALGDDKYIKTEILIYNDILSVYDIADHYFAENRNLYDMFLLSFDLYLAFLGNDGLYAGMEPGEINVLYHEGGLPIPHYFQTDYTNVGYGNGTISSSGCALACIAMTVSYLKQEEISPVDVLKYTGNKYYVAGAGSSWSIFSECAKFYELSCTNLGKDRNAVKDALQKGKPVIASMGPGTFTGSGHFIVIRGTTADGHFLINDPNMNNYGKYGTDRFKVETVMKEAKNFWSYE